MNSSATKTISDTFSDINLVTTQRAFAFMIGLLIIGIIASSFLVRMYPAFIFLYIFILVFSVFISVFLSNAYEKFMSVEELNAIAVQQPMINFFMENMVLVVVGVAALSMIITFSKIISPTIVSGGGGEGLT
jgi:small-conductance mechanosensitive channel